MRNQGEWNPYYMDQGAMFTPQGRMYPWLYPYGTRLNCWNLWNSPERMEDEMDSRRLQELYPIMARRLQPYVEEVCGRLEYPGSMMYDEYPDRLSLLHQAKAVWQAALAQENFEVPRPQWEQMQDLIGVLLLQEMLRRRKKKRTG